MKKYRKNMPKLGLKILKYAHFLEFVNYFSYLCMD